jgi:hypothetical protein
MAMLIAANADVNAADEGGDTPLHCVAQVGFSDCVFAPSQRWCERAGAKQAGPDAASCCDER